MQIRTFETANNTYFLGYGRTAKTTYEQQQENKERFMILAAQKLIGLLFIMACISFSLIAKEGSGVLLSLIGLYPLLSKKPVFIL